MQPSVVQVQSLDQTHQDYQLLISTGQGDLLLVNPAEPTGMSQPANTNALLSAHKCCQLQCSACINTHVVVLCTMSLFANADSIGPCFPLKLDSPSRGAQCLHLETAHQSQPGKRHGHQPKIDVGRLHMATWCPAQESWGPDLVIGYPLNYHLA